jgi:Asp-tRNA(Asn)/Glu-tRNA(Gln) amidotransferase C subunit
LLSFKIRFFQKEGLIWLLKQKQESCGKTEGMAECVKQSDKDIVLFVDSDSFIEPNMMKKMVKYFELKNVGAVAGQAFNVVREDVVTRETEAHTEAILREAPAIEGGYIKVMQVLK